MHVELAVGCILRGEVAFAMHGKPIARVAAPRGSAQPPPHPAAVRPLKPCSAGWGSGRLRLNSFVSIASVCLPKFISAGIEFSGLSLTNRCGFRSARVGPEPVISVPGSGFYISRTLQPSDWHASDAFECLNCLQLARVRSAKDPVEVNSSPGIGGATGIGTSLGIFVGVDRLTFMLAN
jgi:hypothetical protein